LVFCLAWRSNFDRHIHFANRLNVHAPKSRSGMNECEGGRAKIRRAVIAAMHHAIYGARIEPWPEPNDGRPQISALTGRQCPVDILRDGPERSLRCAQDRPGPKELPSTGPGRCQRLQRESRRHRSYL
jgi:hypothetical protein